MEKKKGRPKIKEGKHITLNLRKDNIKKLKRLSYETNISMSNLVDNLIEELE